MNHPMGPFGWALESAAIMTPPPSLLVPDCPLEQTNCPKMAKIPWKIAKNAIFSDGSNNVRSSMFDRSKAKIWCSSSITIRWTRSSSFDVRKNDVRVSSMSNLVNVVKTVLGSKFDVRSFEAKNRVFEFYYQQMNTFEFVRCSKNDVQVRSMFDKIVFDPSLIKLSQAQAWNISSLLYLLTNWRTFSRIQVHCKLIIIHILNSEVVI